MSQDVEAEFGELADKLTEWMVRMMANRLEAAVRVFEDFDRDELRAKFMGAFEEHRQRYPIHEEG